MLSKNQVVIASLAKFVDWSTIQVSAMLRPPLNGRSPQLEEALQFLKRPDFVPVENQPARITFEDRLHFSFPTPHPCVFEENNVVHGRFYRCGERWQDRPVIVLLHGRDDFIGYRCRYPLIARRCNFVGFNAATLVAPYHFQRRPRQFRKLSRPDYLLFAEATSQAIAEIRSLTGWLLEQGCPGVVLWGSSMGGWLAGLTVCRDSRFAAAVLAKPAVRSNPSMAKLILRRGIRESLQRLRPSDEMLDLTAVNLTSAQPLIPKERILLIEGIHDLFAPRKPIEELWEAWDRPEIWRLPHGHISLSLMPGLTCRVLGWLAAQLDKGLPSSDG